MEYQDQKKLEFERRWPAGQVWNFPENNKFEANKQSYETALQRIHTKSKYVMIEGDYYITLRSVAITNIDVWFIWENETWELHAV